MIFLFCQIVGIDAITSESIEEQKAGMVGHIEALRRQLRFKDVPIIVILENNLQDAAGYLGNWIQIARMRNVYTYYETGARQCGFYKSLSLTVSYREETYARIVNK